MGVTGTGQRRNGGSADLGVALAAILQEEADKPGQGGIDGAVDDETPVAAGLDQCSGPAMPSWGFSAPRPPPGSGRGCGTLIGQQGCCLLSPAVPVFFQVRRNLALTVQHRFQGFDAFEEAGSIRFCIASFRTLLGFQAKRPREFRRVNRIAAIFVPCRAKFPDFYSPVDGGLAFAQQLCGL